MKKKLCLLLSALLVFPLLLSGCGKDGKKLLEEAFANTAEIKTTDVDFLLKADMSSNGISVSPNISGKMESGEGMFHLKLDLGSFMSMALLNSLSPLSEDLYVKAEGDKVMLYGKDKQTGGYIKASLASGSSLDLTSPGTNASAMGMMFNVLTGMSRSIKVTGSEEINGVQCDVVTMRLDFAKISKMAGTTGKELSDEEKIMFNTLSECIDLKFYVSRSDVKLYGIRLGTNDRLSKLLEQVSGTMTGVDAANISDARLEAGITFGYDEAAREIPAEVLAAQEVSEETFAAQSALFSLFGSKTDGLYDQHHNDPYDDWDDGTDDLFGI